MQVVHIINSLGKGSGVNNVVYNYNKHLHDKIHFKYIYINDVPLREQLVFPESWNIETFKFDLKKFIFNAKYRLELLEYTKNTDIVHNHVLNMSYLFIPYIKKNNPSIRFVGHAHSSRLSSTWFGIIRNRILTINIQKLYDLTCGCSKIAINEWFGEQKKYFVLPNPIDCDLVETALLSEKNKHEHDKQKFKMVTVGRLSPEKNHIFLLKLLKKLEKIDDSFHLTIIGEGEEKKKLESYISQCNLETKVSISGFLDQKDLYSELTKFDCFLFPSLFEGLGNTLLEAQMLSLPSLSSDLVPEETDLGRVKYLPLDLDLWVNEVVKIRDSRLKYSKEPYRGIYCSKNVAICIYKLYVSLLNVHN